MKTIASQPGGTSRPSTQFPCSVCGKDFDRKKSQIRHSSYCRKRARCPPRPRKKSCLRCTKAKRHCDSASPTCSRCVRRGFTCIYQHSTPHVDRLGEQSLTTAPSSDQSSLLGPISGSSSAQSYGEIAPHDAEALLLADDYLFQVQALFDVVPSPAVQEHVLERECISPALLHHCQAMPVDASFSDHTNRMDSVDFEAFCSLAFQPVLRAPRSFIPRTVKYQQLSLNRKFVICTLNAYPQMLPGKSPPPFLHPQCLVRGCGRRVRTSLPEPLDACSGIVSMWSVKNKNNSAFIWRSIRTEQERILESCHTYTDWTTLAALQAVCIYFILRVAEQDEDVTDFDVPLILTMIKLSMKLGDISVRHFKPSNECAPTWEGWILAESVQRTIFIIFMVDFLFDISAGSSNGCDAPKYLVQMRLPCSKALWKANTRSEWEKEYVAQMNQQKHSYPTFIDLIRHEVDDGSLERWMAEMDELGMLVVSAASLADEVKFGLGSRQIHT